VIGVDLQPYRLQAAERVAGSEVINIQEEEAVERIRDMTDGRGSRCLRGGGRHGGGPVSFG
jgi:threonine dehydrogenase-like Zn-dependent dehydrogenase